MLAIRVAIVSAHDLDETKPILIPVSSGAHTLKVFNRLLEDENTVWRIENDACCQDLAIEFETVAWS